MHEGTLRKTKDRDLFSLPQEIKKENCRYQSLRKDRSGPDPTQEDSLSLFKSLNAQLGL